MQNNPLVSVVMPTYNRAEYLADSIRSIIAQTYKNWELVIVDDGSTDSSKYILDYYANKEPRIKVIYAEHAGIAKTRNTAINASKGSIIAVMDSDDICTAERLKIALDTLAKTDSDAFYSAYLRANEDGQPIDGVLPAKKFGKEFTTVEEIIKTQVIPHVTIIATRECFVDNPYDEKHTVNDDLGLVLSWWKAGYKFCMSKKPLVMVRYHDQSISVTHDKEVKKITEELRKKYA